MLTVSFGDTSILNASLQQVDAVPGCPHQPLHCTVFTLEHTYPAVQRYNVSVIISNRVSTLTQSTEALVEEEVTGIQVIMITPSAIRLGDYINATVVVDSGTDVSFQWEILCTDGSYSANGRTIHIKTIEPGTCEVSVSASSPLYANPRIYFAPYPVTVRAPIGGIKVDLPFGSNCAALVCQVDGSCATQILVFSAQAADEVDFSFDFGDGSPSVNVSGTVQMNGIGASAYHQYRQEGMYVIRVTAYDEFYSATHQAGPYYVERAPNGLLISRNPSRIHKDEVVNFTASLDEGTNVTYTWNMGDQTTYVNEGPVITHTYSSATSHNVTVTARNKVGSSTSWSIVVVLCRVQAVSVLTTGTVFATDTNIVFQAVTADLCATELVWHFGDGPPERTTRKRITKRYGVPNRYNVIVNASNSFSFFTSDIYPITVQRRVIPNRLVASPSVLVNNNVTFECRINSGTNESYRWIFGDGTIQMGRNISSHIYNREGEFTVEVLIFNNVSSAVLKKQIFVVRERCQPPQVKHMGPARIRVRRYQPLVLGVTFEAAISCNISQGLFYRWSFLTSIGTRLLLPPSIDVQKQTISLPSYLLEYGNYNAVARVQVIGNVVYSNYTVPIEVPPSLPVSVITGGNHLFISRMSASSILLNGSESYDPDYPGAKMRFYWRCSPASRQKQSCFIDTPLQPFHSTSESITLRADLLDGAFDQFLVTLVVASGDRVSSEAHVFLSVYSDPTLRPIQLTCSRCEGMSVNWNTAFSIQALCPDCTGMDNLSYSWDLHLINATESSPIEVPFCRVVDLMGPSSIFGAILPFPGKITDASLLDPNASTASPMSQTNANGFTSAFTMGTTPMAMTSFNTPRNAAQPTGGAHLNISSTLSTYPVGVTPNTTSAPKIDYTDIGMGDATVGEQFSATAMFTTTTAKKPELPYPGPGFLEEGSSGGRPARIRRSENESSTTISSVDWAILPTQTPADEDPSSRRFGSSRDFMLPSDISEGEVGSSRPGHRPFYEGGPRDSETMERHIPGQRSRNVTSGTIIGRGEWGSDTSNFTDLIIQDFETHYTGVQEGGGASGGRPAGESSGSTSVSPGSGVVSQHGGGDDLVDSLIDVTQHVALLMPEWRKYLIPRSIFQRFTASGISSQAVSFKPFSLKPSKMYMLDVSVASNDVPVGRAQLYFTVHEKPHGMTCQMQPRHGFELNSIFSIFCTSGKEDLLYEFSYRVGNSSRKTLYKGRDIQYYFSLPAGDPNNNYKVNIFIEITNRFGSRTQPCEINVIVMPTFLKNNSSSPKTQDKLYFESLKNLSTLLLMGSHIEICNYIALLTTVLNRLYTEESRTLYDLQSQTRNSFISSVCGLSVQDQEEMIDLLTMLSELMTITKQVSLDSAFLVMHRVKEITKLVMTPGKFVLDKNLMSKLILVISNALEVSDNRSEKAVSLMLDGVKSITDLLLKYVLLSDEPHFYVGTKLMEIQTTIHNRFQNIVQTVYSTTFYLPDAVNKHIYARIGDGGACYIIQTIHFTKNPYSPTKSPLKIVGDVVDLSLYNCTSRRKIDLRGLTSPIKMDFAVKRNDVKYSNHTSFSLLRDKVNNHQFMAMPDNQQEVLHITVEFSKPQTKAFPVMLLLRYSQKPTPTNFNMKQIYSWDGKAVQMFIPATSLKGSCYMAILDADYSRKTKNKYLASVVNYTVGARWTQCLYWDETREWKSDGCYPQQGPTAATINCRCNHLSTFTVAERPLGSNFEMSDVSLFLSAAFNLVPCFVVGLSLALYVLLAIACKVADHHEEKKNGYILLQDNASSDHQAYAIIIDTGFRSRAKTTAKVYIVLHGEDGVSETRELYCADKPLFERNSRHTFIMSLPDSLGPIWKMHVWHNNSGLSPSWYISHVLVKDLITGTSWFFPAECWLAVDEGDGKVERELTPISNGLGFKKLLYCRLTEYLEDFHLWVSVYSRPSHSWFTHTQRLTLCLVLLLGYMCLNSWLIHSRPEEYTAEFGLIDFSAASVLTGVITTLAFLPVAVLLSLLFRLTKTEWRKDFGEDQSKATRGSTMYSREDPQSSLWEEDTINESYLTWQNFQQWAQDAWKKKYERDSFTPIVRSRHQSERSRMGSHYSSDRTSSGFEDGSSRDNNPVKKDISDDVHSDYSSDSSTLSENKVHHVLKGLPHWCSYMAWGSCVLIACICIVITATIGLRFGPTKCILWLHALFFSTVFCIFIVQPFVILVVAAAVAWMDRERSDFFIGALCEATKHLECKPGPLPKPCFLQCRPHLHDHSTEFDKMLAARQRARYLRLARPPKPSQLKETKDRIRKNTLIQQTVREFVMYIAMLFLLIFLTFGKFSSNEYLLNHAVRSEFTRNPRTLFTEIETVDEWWDWSFTALLEGLYWDTGYNRGAAETGAGPVGGKCFLIGSPILRQLSVLHNASCAFPVQFMNLIPDCNPPYSPSNRAPEEMHSVLNPENDFYHQCGQTQCYEGRGSVVKLGRSRSEAYSMLHDLRKTSWINRRTRAVVVEFALYNPPTSLFTSVSLLAELPPSGGVVTSSFIESVRIYQNSCVLDYLIMVSEMVFLVLILIQYYLQLSTMIQRGFLNFCQEPWNWVEMVIITLSLCYYVYFIYRLILAVDIIDHLQRGFFKVFVDLHFISSWDQCARSMHGVIVFLVLIKCIRLLRIHKVTAPSVSMLRLSFFSVIFTLVAGMVFVAAYSSMGYVLFTSKSYTFSSIARSCKAVLLYFLGVREIKNMSSFDKFNQVSVACYYGIFFIIMTVLWTGTLKGVLISFAKESKKSVRSKHVVALREVAAHTWEKVLSFVGRQWQKSAESVAVPANNLYLDEFENLIDELLFRLNAFSNSLHHSLPAKPYHNTEEEEEEDEQNPLTSTTDYFCSQVSENHHVEEWHIRENDNKDGQGLLLNHPGKTDEFSARPSTDDCGCAKQNQQRSYLECELKERHHPKCESLHLSAAQKHLSSQSRCTDSSFDPNSTISRSSEQLLPGELFSEAPAVNTCQSCMSGSGSLSQQVQSPSQESVSPAQVGPVDASPAGNPCVDSHACQSQRLESGLSSQPRCASASTSAKSQKTLKRSPTTVIEPLDVSSAGQCTTHDPGLHARGSLEADNGPKRQRLTKPALVLTFTQYNSNQENTSKGKTSRATGGEELPIGSKRIAVKTLQNAIKVATNLNVTVPDAPDTNGQELRGFIRQCW
ncbi:polycystin-1-like protein 1 [Ambystoma mexicanum]|uniref:polycystin-1-like protein 1 n=1 Tax=Ambystoma mexicanum TaxID=8296 RepID=UPI0037E81902